MKYLISVYLAILVVTTAVNGTRVPRLRRCPVDFFTAEIILTADILAPASSLDSSDPNLSFFRDEIRFSEAEIDLARQSAIDFFNTRFGLDFSQTDPNIPERRVFQNATFDPFFAGVVFTASINNWLVTGNTRSSKCFDTREGGFVVNFISKQVLHGTYGGTEGIMVGPGNNLVWGYYSINAYETTPLLIQLNNNVPARSTADNIFVDSNRLFHRTLGTGSEKGLNTFTPVRNGSFVQFITRRVLVFPDVLPSALPSSNP